MTTALSVTATPGAPQTFSPKTPATGGKSSNRVTALAVTATPGGIHAFVAKTPPGSGGKPSDRITALSITATPGGLRVFVAKTAAAIIPVEEAAEDLLFAERRSKPGTNKHTERLAREDEEILAIIMAAMSILQ